MTWRKHDNIESFLRSREKVLYGEESRFVLTWAAIQRAQQTESGSLEEDFWTFQHGGVGTAHVFTEKRRKHLVLSGMSEAEAMQLASVVQKSGLALEGVEGPWTATHAFVEVCAKDTGMTWELEMDQGLYELRAVRMPDLRGGELVRGTASHREVLEEMALGFCRECFPNRPISQAQISARVERFIGEGKAFLWRNRDGACVSMAAVVRESPNTGSISWVYTPPALRGRGYAACAVAALSQALLDRGKRACNLHTDLANPTSNGVYTRLGYEMIERMARMLIQPSRAPSGG